ncbi:endonuclease III-like [Ylistrum balloti]|uniref:endonuclease III-like n=1 Tax=Ylistrum balloti TaxID=509963 RepID=UPI002905A03A|nr:endonuclease III-like [Ylistrum balloti]
MPRESLRNKQQRAQTVCQALEQAYPHSKCALLYETPFQLLVATVLSAQTTDLAVNRITPGLFTAFPTPHAMAQAPEGELEQLINSIGLWRNKAKFLRGLSAMLVQDYDGKLPQTVVELKRLPGVAKKTATAVLGSAFGLAVGITVDTHMLRIHRLLNLSQATTADKMSTELERLIDPSYWTSYTHRIIDHGRLVCVARKPRCGVCPLTAVCPSAYQADHGYQPINDTQEPASAKGLSWLA